MGENTRIEWAHHTFNPWEGCAKIGPGCDNCYAADRNARFNGGEAVHWGPHADRRRTSERNWDNPLRWDRLAQKAGRRDRVFCASLADVFDNAVPPTWRKDLWELIQATPNLDWLLLTKRVGIIERYLPADWGGGYHNVWLGLTVVNQAEFNRDVPTFTQIPCRLRFLSCEPLLGPLSIKGMSGIDWIITGGESGPKARPAHPDWFRQLRDEAKEQGQYFFFKQWGEWKEVAQEARETNGDHVTVEVGSTVAEAFFRFGDLLIHPDSRCYTNPEQIPFDVPCRHIRRVGKKTAGAVLDGMEHRECPG